MQGYWHFLKLLRIVWSSQRRSRRGPYGWEGGCSQICQIWFSASFLGAKSAGLASSSGSTVVTGKVAAGWSRMFQMDVYAK